MLIAKKQFQPTLIPSIATFVFLIILVALGFWQLDRADQKREIINAVTNKMALRALSVVPELADIEASRYRAIKLRGRFDTEHLIYIDNKILFGKVGYFVVSPFIEHGSNKRLLINLGWIAMGVSRLDLPRVNLPNTEVSVSGVIKTNVDNVFSLTDSSFDEISWPLVVQWLSPTQLSLLLGTEFVPMVILINDPNKDELLTYHEQFKRHWKFISSSADTHTSYAMQWFSLALVLVIIFITVNLKKII